MKFYIFVFLTSFIFIGCVDGSSEEDSFTYFGGEVIKPNNNYVIFQTDPSKKDTIFLDDNNRFLHKIENHKSGLYRFDHGGEYQTFVLEENDSILFRMNTDDFDESLVYTGRGAKKNNFLIKSFVEDEKEDDEFIKHHQMEPEEFERHIEVKRQLKRENLEHFLLKSPQSELFETIAKLDIDFNFYTYKEKYPFGHFGHNKLVHYKDLPDDFYNYREKVDFNNESIFELPSYKRFLIWHFHNIGLNKFYEDGRHIKFDRRALDYNVEKLHLIKEKINNQTIEHYLLWTNVYLFLEHNDNPEASAEMLAAYLEIAESEENKVLVKKFYEKVQGLKPGNLIPDAELYTYDRDLVSLRSVINRPTVIFCWLSRNKMLTRNSHYMARSLKTRFPDVDFIAINATDSNLENWKRTVSKFDFPKENEYLFKNTQKALDDYVISYGHRVFIIDKNGVILNSKANLFSDEIQNDLEELLARSEN